VRGIKLQSQTEAGYNCEEFDLECVMKDVAEEAARQRALVDAKQDEIEKVLIDRRLELEDDMGQYFPGWYPMLDMQINYID